jgi:signal transduction histidine kinase
MFVSLYGKYVQINQSYIVYFDSRYILLATTILPAIVFRLDERVKIAVCLISTLLCLIFFDPIHNALGLGYYQRGFTAVSYYYINYITVTAYFILLFGVLTLKTITERAQEETEYQIKEKEVINRILLEKNEQLTQLNFNVEAQNEEMQQQHEELSASREKLEEANQVINVQKNELALYNSQLQELVDEKSRSLTLTNEELVKHNNELRQFSYTISHNLRGPVARLLGLAHLFHLSKTDDEAKNIVEYILQSTQDLDSVLKDLSIIIDIRNEVYTIREKIAWQDEWDKVHLILKDQIKTNISFQVDFLEAPFVYAIRPMIHSILYNLVSNAIKYQSPDRLLAVAIRSRTSANKEIILEVEDNGLGIDLTRHGQNLFKLYKRFHTHVSGKGLGLFIVKTQAEIMNGKIEVESQLNIGTLFRVLLPKPQEVDHQVFLENEAAQLYYDAEINTTVINWKRSISSQEYHAVFETILQTLKTYHSPGWIADLREQGRIGEEDQIWFVSTIIPEAIRAGLKRIIAIGFKDPIRETYYDRMKAKTAEFGLEFYVCETLEEARDVVKEHLILPA